MDHVALSPHGARRGGFRCAGLALRKPVSARAGPEGCSAGGDAGRRGVAGGLVEALFRWTTYGPSGLAASRHARRRPIEPFSPGVVVRGSGWRGREPFGVVGRIGPVLVEMCILPSRCAFCSRDVQGGVRGWLHHYGFGGVVDVPRGVRVADEVRLRAMELIAEGRSAWAAARGPGRVAYCGGAVGSGGGCGTGDGGRGRKAPWRPPGAGGRCSRPGPPGPGGPGPPGPGACRSRPRAGGCTIRV